MASTRAHWEQIYTSRPAAAVSWFQEHPATSLRLIRGTGIALDAPILDAGGGASTLADDLESAGYTAITVLDHSAAALVAARQRLGARTGRVRWLEADITTTALHADAFALWHDRALFHFLLSADERRAYAENIVRALRPGGHLLVATFAADGPTQCSGLPIVRYNATTLQAELGASFVLQHQEREVHRTPSGGVQNFHYFQFRKHEVREVIPR